MKKFSVGDEVIFTGSHHSDIKKGLHGTVDEVLPNGYAIKVTTKFQVGHYQHTELLTRIVFAFQNDLQPVAKSQTTEVTEPLLPS